MNEDNSQNSQEAFSIPGYFYDKKKNRYFLIDNELKKQLKEEEFKKQVNDAKRKNRKTNIEEKESTKKKFHRIHGIKEMKKKKKNASAHKLNIKNKEQECKYSVHNSHDIFNKEKNLELIKNELNSLKKSIPENQNIYNILKNIRNFSFRENSILSLPPIFINRCSYEYIFVQDLCERQPDNTSSFCQHGDDKGVSCLHHLNIQKGLNILSIFHASKSLNNQNDNVNGEGVNSVRSGRNISREDPSLNPKRNDSMELSAADIKFFNVCQKLMSENMINELKPLDIGKNESFNSYRSFRKQSTCSNKTEEQTKFCNNRNKKNYFSKELEHVKTGNNMNTGCDELGRGLLFPKLFGQTYEKLNSCNIQSVKSKIIMNRYKANFYYFYSVPSRIVASIHRNNNEIRTSNRQNNISDNSITDNNFNYIYNHHNTNRDEHSNTNVAIDENYVMRRHRDSIHNNTSYSRIFQERSERRFEEHVSLENLDAIRHETPILKTYKPVESFFHLFTNPFYEDFIFSTTKENNCSFSLGAIDMMKFIQKDKRSPLDDIVHENMYYNTETKYFCTYSKENSELLCVSPQILSHFSIFNSEYIAYSSYPNMKDEKSLLCMFNIVSFFEPNPKIVTYNFKNEINYFRLFPSMQDNYYYHHNGNTWGTDSDTMNDGYSFHHNNKIDKIFICGSNPCFSFNAIKDDGVPYCIWDSKKLKVHDLLSMNEDITSFVHNILIGCQHPFTNLNDDYISQKRKQFQSKRWKEKLKSEIENNKNEHENPYTKERKAFIDYDSQSNTHKKNNHNKRKHPCKDPNDNVDNVHHFCKHETSKKKHNSFIDKSKHHLNNRSNKFNHPQHTPTVQNTSEKMRNKHNNASHNYYPSNSGKYNDNKKKGICCENVRKSNNNVFLCCNTEHLYLCDIRCNFLNTISKLKPNEGYVNKIYALNNSYQYILSKTNNHIGLYDMRYVSYKYKDDKTSTLVTSYERFVDNNNLKKHLNDFYIIDNEQFIVSLDTYTNSVYIYDIMNVNNKIINLDGNSDYSIYANIHAYNNLSRIPYIYSCNQYDDEYHNYYKKKSCETKATDTKHTNHFNPLRSYPQEDLFIGLNVQSILPLFFVKQKYSKHNFISINEGGFICTINV
ncbi:hypothetical protein, conserved [Plasmodium gonderi]|uniref:Uncharacterized protein n=1 Tax=Plasmodium gonderi TaxID=77519 RepID=A0A1Y1JE04_PLAGO|nr:hypothetical protein, conserved [Plasmodium gonderi]GAW78982.1 hypothetical protein, conserved [Plasmodium gonderi]